MDIVKNNPLMEIASVNQVSLRMINKHVHSVLSMAAKHAQNLMSAVSVLPRRTSSQIQLISHASVKMVTFLKKTSNHAQLVVSRFRAAHNARTSKYVKPAALRITSNRNPTTNTSVVARLHIS